MACMSAVNVAAEAVWYLMHDDTLSEAGVWMGLIKAVPVDGQAVCKSLRQALPTYGS